MKQKKKAKKKSDVRPTGEMGAKPRRKKAKKRGRPKGSKTKRGPYKKREKSSAGTPIESMITRAVAEHFRKLGL